MNTATVHDHRPMLPRLNLLIVGTAVALGVVAIATDDTGSLTQPPAPVVTTRAVEAPPADASPRADSSSIAGDAGDCRFAVPGVVTRC